LRFSCCGSIICGRFLACRQQQYSRERYRNLV
jgi:hypothetical protein